MHFAKDLQKSQYNNWCFWYSTVVLSV
jgi:hypothetical protein